MSSITAGPQDAGSTGRLIAAVDDSPAPLHGKCQVLVECNARVINRPSADGALWGGADSAETCPLVRGVAAVADQGKLDGQPVHLMLAIAADGPLR